MESRRPLPGRFAIRSQRVVFPDGVRAATIVVEDGRITAIQKESTAPAGLPVHDVGHHVLMPGIVDCHVNLPEPGSDGGLRFAAATGAAVAGGVTTVADMPSKGFPATVCGSELERKRRKAEGNCHTNVVFLGGLIPGSHQDMEELLRKGAVGIQAILSDLGHGDFPPVGESVLRHAMPRIAAVGGKLMVHAELPGLAPPMVNRHRYAEYLASRPMSFERKAIELIMVLCRETGCAVHIQNLTAAGAISDVMVARTQGLPITLETCPHYLYFASEDIPDGRTDLKCAPPIREMINRERLWQALSAGHIDLVASDHASHSMMDTTRSPGDSLTEDFEAAHRGISSLELLLPATWTGCKLRGATLEMLGRWLCAAPADLLGLSRTKGRIETGYDADLVVWDADAQFTVDTAQLINSGWTPYHGERMWGVVQSTYVGGQLTYDHARPISERVGQPAGEVI